MSDAFATCAVIPAEAGIHVATVKVKMGPRFRGDDGTMVERVRAGTMIERVRTPAL